MNFWEMIQKIIRGDEIESESQSVGELIGYDPDMIEMYNYVITAHVENDDSKLTISFFKPEQWEMILATAEITETDVEEIVRGLSSDDVKQMIISAEDWNPEDGLDNLL